MWYLPRDTGTCYRKGATPSQSQRSLFTDHLEEKKQKCGLNLTASEGLRKRSDSAVQLRPTALQGSLPQCEHLRKAAWLKSPTQTIACFLHNRGGGKDLWGTYDLPSLINQALRGTPVSDHSCYNSRWQMSGPILRKQQHSLPVIWFVSNT